MNKKIEIKRAPVKSSNLRSVGHCSTSNCLDIEFGNGVYRYEDVPAKLHEDFMKADSPGKFFAEHIKGKFKFKKV